MPGGEEYLLVSVYLRDSEGLSDYNLGIMSDIGALVQAEAVPTLIGGDWNVAPEEVADTIFVNKLQG